MSVPNDSALIQFCLSEATRKGYGAITPSRASVAARSHIAATVVFDRPTYGDSIAVRWHLGKIRVLG